MSLRSVKQVIKPKPTIEGAGVKLQRAFGFGKTKDFDPFLLLDDFRNDNPNDRDFHGTRTAASRPSPTSSLDRSSTATVWATRAK